MSANTTERTVTACVLIIGNEILSGRTQDANLAFLATTLNEFGVQIHEARVIPDVDTIIIETLNAVRTQFDYVFTTGGIGPTHDDITAECVARAFDLPLVIHPEIVTVLERREAPPEVMAARMRMARVPEGATLIDNPNGPQGFRIGNVFVMAGIPRVMQAMVQTLGDQLDGGKPVRSRSITAYLSEGEVASPLGAIQESYSQLDLGSYPFYREDRYGTQLVMRGTDEAALNEMLAAVRQMIIELGGEFEDA